MVRVARSEDRGWITAVNAAAVRLAAEAGDEVDLDLAHLGPAGAAVRHLARQVTRLEESAELSDVAADLAALLWAECANVPPIATILAEPSVAAALEAVAEARRVASARLAAGVSRIGAGEPATAPTAADLLRRSAAAVQAQTQGNRTQPVATARPAASTSTSVPAAEVADGPEPAGVVDFGPPGEPPAGSTAAAILRLGRRLRRA